MNKTKGNTQSNKSFEYSLFYLEEEIKMTKLYKKEQLEKMKQKYTKEIIEESDRNQLLICCLEAKSLHMDYTFLMEDDTYIHVEFQTTDKRKDDLRRLRAYESLLSLKIKK